MVRCQECGWENLPGADVCDSCSHDLTHLNVSQATTRLHHRIVEDPIRLLALCPPVIVDREAPLHTVLHAMREQGVDAVVITHARKITGIFTERDFLYRVALHSLDVKSTPVNAVMTSSPVTLKHTHSLAFALREMSIGRYRHLPVMDERRHCLGILGAEHILSYMIEQLESEGCGE